MKNRKSLLVVSQVYVPDPASVGQHMADAAADVAARGFPVRVVASASGYDDPSVRYPLRETIDGVDVIRVPVSSLGKQNLISRIGGQALFLVQTLARGLITPDLGAVLVSTSPPMASAVAIAVSIVRRVPIVYWAMDINPDQAVSLGVFKQDALPVRMLDALNRAVLARSRAVVTLDRFMAGRLNRKLDVSDKLDVFPPWPHEDHLDVVPHESNPFRERHGLVGKTVIMYSGNHGWGHPLRTLLDAAERLRDRTDIVFAFIGGGVGKREVAEAVAGGGRNILDLPYQPLSDLKYSLSAADAHVVTMGDEAVGILHPCKVYGAMAVARPVLYFGPRPSHVTDLLDRYDVGWHVSHGDVDSAVRIIKEIAGTDRARLVAMGARAREAVDRSLSKRALCSRFGGIVEAVIEGRPGKGPPDDVTEVGSGPHAPQAGPRPPGRKPRREAARAVSRGTRRTAGGRPRSRR